MNRFVYRGAAIYVQFFSATTATPKHPLLVPSKLPWSLRFYCCALHASGSGAPSRVGKRATLSRFFRYAWYRFSLRLSRSCSKDLPGRRSESNMVLAIYRSYHDTTWRPSIISTYSTGYPRSWKLVWLFGRDDFGLISNERVFISLILRQFYLFDNGSPTILANEFRYLPTGPPRRCTPMWTGAASFS